MSKTKIKRIIIAAVVLVVLIFGASYARQALSEEVVDDTTFIVRKETFETTIDISGNILAASEQTLKAGGNGTVKKVFVHSGQPVKRGDILIQLDAMQQEFNLAKLDYEIEQKKISASPKEIQLMKSQREVMNRQLDDRRVIAYFDGIVADLSVAEGDYLEATNTVGTIIDRSYMKAKVEVVESDSPKLELGQKVIFTFPAYPDLKVEGYVKSFPSVGRITKRGATVVDVEIRIDNPPAEILPNFSFTGKIQVTEPQTVLIVERSGIGYDEGNSFVEKVLPNGSVEKVQVEVLPYDIEFVRILSGLNEKDEIKNQGSGVQSEFVRVEKTSVNSGRRMRSVGGR